MGVSIALSKPAYCAACFQAKPDATFVDLGSTYEGPTFRDEGGTVITVDDNIVCEDCVRDAALVLALHVDPIREVEIQRDEARQQARSWQDYAEGLEYAHSQRPESRRLPGRPRKVPDRPVGVE
jgi:hypothetical protein